MKFGCSIGIFLNSAHLICQTTDISKCFRGSLRLRDNEGRLYVKLEDPLISNDKVFCSLSVVSATENA